MPTTVTLSPELAKFVDDLVQTSKFATREEAVNDALMRRKEEIEWLRAELKPAIEAFFGSRRIRRVHCRRHHQRRTCASCSTQKIMGRRIVHSPDSRRDYEEVYLYIAADNPAAAEKLLRTF
jgi:Arc/MetJ-type ribon-helix-helix transcriptional regulator